MIPVTMRDQAHERSLDRDGHTLLPGLAAGDLAFLREVHATAPHGPEPDSTPPAPVGGEGADGWKREMAPGREWRISADESEAEERGHLQRQMAGFWKRIADQALADHRIVFTSFLTKHPGIGGVLPLHQDPTFIDERSYRAVTVWVALDDITRADRNGPLHVLSGSHRVGLELRGTGTEPSYIDRLEDLWPHAVPVDAHAGDVLIMDARLLHGSPPNWSDKPRAALAGVLVPREAPLCHAVAVEDEMVEIIRVDETFYWQTSPRSLRAAIPPGYPVVATVPRAAEPTSGEALLAQQRDRPA